MPSKRLSKALLLLEPEQHELVKTYSELNDISMSEIFRELIEEHREQFAHGIQVKLDEKRQGTKRN